MVVYYQIAGKQVGSHVVRSPPGSRHIFLMDSLMCLLVSCRMLQRFYI